MINIRDLNTITCTNKEYKHQFDIAAIDPAFRNINKDSIGFHIWRVENNKAEIINPDEYGLFLDNCTYIIYASSQSRDHFVNKNTLCRTLKDHQKQYLYRYIHFWLGKNCSVEKSGNLAYKVVELDNYLENTAVQYRESHDYESNRFKSYFKNDGITILCHQYEFDKIRLLRVKGPIYPKYIQNIPINWMHFKSNRVMILQTLKYIFIWIGRISNKNERRLALKWSMQLQKLMNKDTEMNLEICFVDDGYEQSMSEIKKCEWNQYLNLSERIVNPVTSAHAIASAKDKIPNQFGFKLYKCGFNMNKYRIEEIKIGKLEQLDLKDSNAAYIIDGNNWCGNKLNNFIWIWLGRLTTIKDKGEAMRNARGFVKKKQYSDTTPIIRIIEGYEPHEFIHLFPIWCEPLKSSLLLQTSSMNFKSFNYCCIDQNDSINLLQRPKVAAETQLIDDGTGDISIYKIENGKFNEIGRSCHLNIARSSLPNIVLYSGKCYLIHYLITFTVSNLMSPSPSNISGMTVRHILYFWSGKNCPLDLRLRGEQLTDELYERLQKNVIQYRIHDGMEPAHFLQIFKGKLIISREIFYMDEDTDSNNDTENKCNYENIFKTDQECILKVIGDASYNCKAILIKLKQTPIVVNVNDCWIIKPVNDNDLKCIWIWCGQNSTGDKREMAKSIGSLFGECTLILQSKEPTNFWESISKEMCVCFNRIIQSELNKSELLSLANYKHLCSQLYVSSIVDNNIYLEQVMQFEQRDLLPENLYLLDIGNLIYIWVGRLCSKQTKAKCWTICQYFLNSYHPFLRNSNIPLVLIQQYYEPVTFIGFFEHWDCKPLEDNIFETLRLEMESNEKSDGLINASQTLNKIYNLNVDAGSGDQQSPRSFDDYPKYSINVLRNNTGNNLDANTANEPINLQRKEVYLTHDDFVSIFKMKFAEFELLPMWKKQDLKKLHKLF